MFLFPVLTPCLAEYTLSWQQVEMHHSSIVLRSLLPTQGARGAGVSPTRLQRGPLQQTSASPNPGAELFLAVPPRTVCPAQKPSPPNPPAPGSQPEPVQRSGIHGWGHPRDTSVSFSIVGTPPTPPKRLSCFLLSHSPLRSLKLCRDRVRLLWKQTPFQLVPYGSVQQNNGVPLSFPFMWNVNSSAKFINNW